MVKLMVVRIRGGVKARKEVNDTLAMLGLTRINHCVLVDYTDSIQGMLQKAKDYITWGEASPETVEILLRKRGRLVGDRRVTEEIVQKAGFSSIKDFAEKLCAGKAEISAVPGLKKVFRLHPPRRGFKSTKRHFGDLGDLGYRGEAINELVKRMV
ncbi:MAG: 50S ribosomal protein L30 [Candidatus Hadarchaeales archaeon]